MSMTAAPWFWVASTSTSSTWACTVTSRAVVGSSAMTSSGSHDSAMAIMARWRMPPEYSCGYMSTRRSGWGMCTVCEHLDGPRPRLLLGDVAVGCGPSR